MLNRCPAVLTPFAALSPRIVKPPLMAALPEISDWARGVLLVGLGAVGRESLFLVRRYLSGASRKDHLEYLAGTATLVKTLKDAGVSMDELNSIAATIKRPSIRNNLLPALNSGRPSQDEGGTVTLEAEQRYGYDGNNYEMKSQAGFDYQSAEVRLSITVRQLSERLCQDELEAFSRAQAAWTIYRDALAEASRAEYSGGTHAALAATLTAIAETNRRTAELNSDLQERLRR